MGPQVMKKINTLLSLSVLSFLSLTGCMTASLTLERSINSPEWTMTVREIGFPSAVSIGNMRYWPKNGRFVEVVLNFENMSKQDIILNFGESKVLTSEGGASSPPSFVFSGYGFFGSRSIFESTDSVRTVDAGSSTRFVAYYVIPVEVMPARFVFKSYGEFDLAPAPSPNK